MISGLTLNALAAQIVEQHQAKVDFKADTRSLKFVPGGEFGSLEFATSAGTQTYAATEHCLRQIADFGDIPFPYARKMLGQEPDLLAENVNRWFNVTPARRMVRTLSQTVSGNGPVARALLSDKYRPIDNFDLAEIVIPKLTDPRLGWKIVSSQITEKRLYIQATSDRLTADIKVGDTVQAGMVISNSEVGAGAFSIEDMIYRLVCTNGMVVGKALKKNHVSRRMVGGFDDTEVSQYFSDDTRRLDDAALFAKISDTLDAMLNEVRFRAIVGKLRETTENLLGENPLKIVEVAAKKLALSEAEQGSVLMHLASGGDLSQYGLVQAVTRTAQDVPSYDRAVELERLGGDVMNAPKATFSVN